MGKIYSREQIAPCVCKLLQLLPGSKSSSGTGFFLFSEQDLYLISASHVVSDLREDAQIIVSDENDKPVILSWYHLTGSSNLPVWDTHSEADISILKLSPDPSTLENHLKGRFLPIDLFPSVEEPPNRDLILTSVGFPLGLGTSGYFSPLTYESKASSGLLTLKRADTHTLCTFFILQDPTIGGYSGCPIFDLSIIKIGAMTTTGGGTICYGITHGTLSDATGGKLAAVTPSFYVHDLLRV
jgi:hypothetical protein